MPTGLKDIVLDWWNWFKLQVFWRVSCRELRTGYISTNIRINDYSLEIRLQLHMCFAGLWKKTNFASRQTLQFKCLNSSRDKVILCSRCLKYKCWVLCIQIIHESNGILCAWCKWQTSTEARERKLLGLWRHCSLEETGTCLIRLIYKLMLQNCFSLANVDLAHICALGWTFANGALTVYYRCSASYLHCRGKLSAQKGFDIYDPQTRLDILPTFNDCL